MKDYETQGTVMADGFESGANDLLGSEAPVEGPTDRAEVGHEEPPFPVENAIARHAVIVSEGGSSRRRKIPRP